MARGLELVFAEEERRPMYREALVREQGPAAAMNNDD